MPATPFAEIIRCSRADPSGSHCRTPNARLQLHTWYMPTPNQCCRAIDNNASERAVSVGSKNYLFAGSDAGGRAAAVLYSVAGTCRRLGLDPFAYFRHARGRIPFLPAGRIVEVFPDRWAVGRPANTP